MTEFMEFDSIEDAFAFMAEQEAKANAQLAPEQQAIVWGDHWVRFMEDYAIFGRIFTEQEVRDMETPLAEDQQEIESIMADLADRYKRGYRYGRAFSIVTPEGELGDTHVANMWPIDRALFEAAEKVEWMFPDLEPEPMAQLASAYEARRAHVLSLVENRPLFRGKEE